LGWGYALVYQMEDFFCDYSRFTRTGAGEDELVAAGGYGLSLGGVEGRSDRMVGAGEEKGVVGERL